MRDDATASNKLLSTIADHTGVVNCVRWSPCGYLHSPRKIDFFDWNQAFAAHKHVVTLLHIFVSTAAALILSLQ
jgi:hypothetical protein